jgi:hypothetical protein
VTAEVPSGYSLRNAQVEDASRIAERANEVNLAEVGFSLTTAEECRDELALPGRDADDDAVLLAEDG